MQHAKPGTKRLTDAQRTLVEDNLGLVGYVVNTRLCVDVESIEDMFQVGVLGLMIAAQKYDSSRGVMFSTFATHCVMNQIRKARRYDKNYRQRNESPEHPQDTASPDEEIAINAMAWKMERLDRNLRFEDAVEDAVMADQIKRLLESQPGQAAQMTYAYLIQGMTQQEIARKWWITQSSVSRSVARTLNWLRKQLEDEENDQHD